MSKCEESVGKMRTKEHSTEHEEMEDPRLDFDYSKDIVTSRLYCSCRDCEKYCNHLKPVQCIDPFLLNMKDTCWIYDGLVEASRTERAICLTTPETTNDKPEGTEEKKEKFTVI